MRCVGNVEFSVLVGVCREKSHAVKKRKLRQMALNSSDVANIDCAVAVRVTEINASNIYFISKVTVGRIGAGNGEGLPTGPTTVFATLNLFETLSFVVL